MTNDSKFYVGGSRRVLSSAFCRSIRLWRSWYLVFTNFQYKKCEIKIRKHLASFGEWGAREGVVVMDTT